MLQRREDVYLVDLFPFHSLLAVLFDLICCQPLESPKPSNRTWLATWLLRLFKCAEHGLIRRQEPLPLPHPVPRRHRRRPRSTDVTPLGQLEYVEPAAATGLYGTAALLAAQGEAREGAERVLYAASPRGGGQPSCWSPWPHLPRRADCRGICPGRMEFARVEFSGAQTLKRVCKVQLR